MPSARPRVLFVSDLAYPAKGRRYCDEDIALTSRLREDFDIAVCHPLDAAALMTGFDAVVVRNSGPVLHYQAAYDAFRERALAEGVRVYNQLSGKGDMVSKDYLLELTAAGFPVIPTVDRAQDLGLLPEAAMYVVKPRQGADSIGLEFVPREKLASLPFGDLLVQPRVDFRYEVSFYFVDHTLQYALYAPDPERRWAWSRTNRPTRTGSSRSGSSSGTTSRTASSAWTPAGHPAASCSSSSWRTSTRISPWTSSPPRPATPSSHG